jgi:fermentation-respiration switch protein FrsA (DUF1100 family)
MNDGLPDDILTRMNSILRRMLSSIIFILITAWLGLCVLLYLFQSHFIYFPSKTLLLTPEYSGMQFEDVSLLTEDNVTLHGWYIPRPEASQTLLFFHGNAGNIADRLDSLKVFHDLGLSILIIDYRGYGLSEGKTSEAGTYRDAEAAWNYLLEQKKLSAEDIVIFGRSLGGAVATWLAQQQQPAALILESTFTSVKDMAAGIYPFLPVSWLSRFHYASIDRIERINCPIMIIHSPDDELVPYRMAEQLYQQAKTPKSFFRLNGGHNDGFLSSQPHYSEALGQFIQQQSVQQ